jgi:IclR family transcriptional regulator, KDG regulon repressor
MNSKPSYHLESVGRAIQLLDCFSRKTPELRLTDLSNMLEMSKAQVLRITSTLELGGYLIRDPETKRYRLGIRLFQLGMLVQEQIDLRRIVHPYLEELVKKAQESARLVVPDADGPICLDLVESLKGTRVYAQLGMRMPWNAGTSPKVILAYLPEDQREKILARGPFKRYTEQTTTDADLLRDELVVIRKDGYHIGRRDLDKDAMGISAPLFNHDGQIVGAVNFSVPVSRLSEMEVAALTQMLIQAAHEISLQLGYQPIENPPSVAATATKAAN